MCACEWVHHETKILTASLRIRVRCWLCVCVLVCDCERAWRSAAVCGRICVCVLGVTTSTTAYPSVRLYASAAPLLQFFGFRDFEILRFRFDSISADQFAIRLRVRYFHSEPTIQRSDSASDSQQIEILYRTPREIMLARCSRTTRNNLFLLHINKFNVYFQK